MTRPLEGRTVLVTRPSDQAAGLVSMLEARGATAVVAPAIRIRGIRSDALEQAIGDLAAGRFAWITVTSAATVDVLAKRIDAADLHAHVAAVGEGTAAALIAWSGHEPDLVPDVYETEALARAFPRGEGSVLCLRADVAPPGLEEGLRSKGWTPTRVDAYRTVLARRLPAGARGALAAGSVDAVTFTSGSTVRGFVRALAGPPATAPAGVVRCVCIGPVTAREARANGFAVAGVASPHTVDGLVEAVERALGRSRTR
jgi:uroporphyrinogen-III synthase